jgi:hypothetical protein
LRPLASLLSAVLSPDQVTPNQATPDQATPQPGTTQLYSFCARTASMIAIQIHPAGFPAHTSTEFGRTDGCQNTGNNGVILTTGPKALQIELVKEEFRTTKLKPIKQDN